MKKYNIKYYLLLICGFLYSFTCVAQENIGGMPVSLQKGMLSTKFSHIPTNIQLPYIDNEATQADADNICSDCRNSYYGTLIEYPINIKSEGTYKSVQDGHLWTLRIESPTAYGMQFYFKRFLLPENATMYIFNEDASMILGGFTSDNNPVNESRPIHFSTQYLSGKNIIIEYFEPSDAEFSGQVELESIGHIFKNIFKEGPYANGVILGPCHKNVSCPEASGWMNEISSVAIILVVGQNNYVGHCSGALINNTKRDGDPLFLTAKHCMSYSGHYNPKYDPDTWIFLFNHNSITCVSEYPENLDSHNEFSSNGCSVLSEDLSENTSDFLLLRLDLKKESMRRYGLCLSGWTLDPNPQPPYTCIHHPAGDVKKIARSDNPVISTWYPNKNEVLLGDQWMIPKWSMGATWNGSSGSPLYDKNKKIIGQLQGGRSNCIGYGSNDSSDWFGKFTTSWDGGLSFYLDPIQTRETSIDAYCIENSSNEGYQPGILPMRCKSKLNRDGFSVNENKTSQIVEVCLKEPITLSTTKYDYSYPYSHCEFPYVEACVRMDNNYNNFRCAPRVFGDIFGIFGWNCYVDRLLVSLIECDGNLNDVGDEYVEWKTIWGDGYNVKHSIDLLTHLPKGASLEVGKYYRVKLAGVYDDGWDEAVRYIYTKNGNVLHFNNTVLGETPSAYEIYIQNSVINNPVEVRAKRLIEIKDGVTINSGYFDNDNNVKGCPGIVLNPLLEQIVWKLKLLKGDDLPNLTLYKLQLNTGLKKFVMQAGVNRIIGGYDLSDNYVSFRNFITTRIANEDFDYALYERVIEALSEISTYEIDGNTLYLMQDDEVIMEFETYVEEEENPEE